MPATSSPSGQPAPPPPRNPLRWLRRAAAPAPMAEAVRREDAPAGGESRLVRLARRVDWGKLGLLVGVLVLAVVAVTLYHTLRHLSFAAVRHALAAISPGAVGLAVLATAGSYIALAGYEVIAVRQVAARRIAPAYAAVTAFIAYSFTFVLGFGVLTSGAVRLRRYLAEKLGTSEILAVTLLVAVSFWLSLATIGGLCLVLEPGVLAPTLGLPAVVDRIAGAVLLLAVAGWFAATAVRPRIVTVADWKLRLPGPRASLAVVLLGLVDTGCAAFALWILLPETQGVPFAAFIVVFVLASAAGLLSHAPGGLGAFEAVVILGLPGGDHAGTVAALVVFRLVYYALPFLLGIAVFAVAETRRGPEHLERAQRLLARTVRPLVPNLTALLVFAGGAVLLLSGSLPPIGSRFAVLTSVLPLPFVEASHFTASVVGGVLLIVGHGLARRLRSSWNLAVTLLAAGALFSLLKGFDYEEALVCLAILAMLLLARAEFYREGEFAGGLPSGRWLLAAAAVVTLCVLVGLIVHRDVDFASSLWWQFLTPGDGSRFLRASLAGAVAVILVAIYRLVHAPAPLPAADRAPTAETWRRVEQAIALSGNSGANLAFLGDKRFLFSELGPGFVMYAVAGSTWLAMDDPVSADEKVTIDLVWRFKELAHRHGGQAAFYQVSAETLPIFVDAGFSFAKLGEDAIIDLAAFSLEGSANARFRQAKSRSERAGLSFEIVPAAQIPALMPALQEISDAWLTAQKGHEKGFSLGYFDRDYLARFDCALVSLEGRPIAFANIWKTADRSQYSIDLMRHRPEMPNGTMDYLFVSLFLALKAEGVATFNLGMAPLAGLPEHPLAPAWTRFGALIYRHGNQFYSFQGLREFKMKFRPEWRPRYLAHPGGLSVARILLDATLLVTRGPPHLKDAAPEPQRADVHPLDGPPLD